MTDLPLREFLAATARLIEALDREAATNGAAAVEPTRPEAAQVAPWREKLWTVPGDTRLTTVQLSEALGRPKSYIYRAVARDLDPLPARRFAGELRFRVSDVIAWYERNEVAP